MIELKDVIHYYLNCRVMVAPFGGQPKRLEQGNLIAVLLHGVDVKLDNWQSSAFLSFDKVKPILRRLEDIENDELKELIIACSRFNLSRCEFEYEQYWVNAIENGRIIDSLNLEMNGVIDMVDYAPGIMPQMEAFQWLIKKGFDLFNLLTTDQAIDAKTINK